MQSSFFEPSSVVEAAVFISAMTFAGIYVFTRRGPLRAVIGLLLHAQATLRCTREVWQSGAVVWRQRYRECLERAQREAGR